MAIVYKNSQYTPRPPMYVGRVWDVRTFTARRNMSDTLDYSDWQYVECTEALVFLGFHKDNGDPRAAHEWFCWVDISNHFTWCGEDYASATVDYSTPIVPPDADTMTAQRIVKEWADMYAAFFEWEKAVKRFAEETQARIEAETRAARAADEARREKQHAAAVRRNEKLVSSFAEAERILAAAHKRGIKKGATVEDSIGRKYRVFWTGTPKYRGKHRAKIGCNDAKGRTHWLDLSEETFKVISK